MRRAVTITPSVRRAGASVTVTVIVFPPSTTTSRASVSNPSSFVSTR
jgi:hypothetical protein